MKRREFIGGPLALAAGAAAIGLQPATASSPAPLIADDYVTFEDYGAVGDGVADDTIAIQAAIDDNPRRELWATRRNYRLTQSLRIMHGVKLRAAQGGVQLLMATANTDHIVIGDGTQAGMMSSLNTVIDGFTFVAAGGVAASTTGSCIFFNFCAFFDVRNCDFYGSNGATKLLFRGMTLYRASDGFIRHCRVRFFVEDGIHAVGSPDSSTPNPYRTVDIRLEYMRVYSCGGYQVYFGPHTNGIFVTDLILLDSTNRPALCIDSDPTSDGANFFIVNVNIEGNLASRGILVSKGQNVQIIGGWIGGIAANGAAVELTSGASSCEINGLKVDYCGLIVSGPANSIKNCEISGDMVDTVNGIVIGPGASDTLVTGCRIRQFTGSAILIQQQPARCVINALALKDSPTNPYVAGAGYVNGPAISAIRSDASIYIQAATQIQLNYGADFFQVIGAIQIEDIVPRNPGRRLTVQAGAGGVTFKGGGVIQLKGSSPAVAVPAYRTIEFVSDGMNWFESGGNY